MKKLTALLLSLLMLIPMITMLISADTATTSLDDKLVLHYDFEGEGSEVYNNKANNGTTEADGKLTDINSALTVGNGTLTTTAGNAARIANAYIGSYVSETVEFTIFFRIKMDSELSPASSLTMYPLINMHKGDAPTMQLLYGDNKPSSGDFFQFKINNIEHRFFGISFEELQADFVNAAIVVYKDESGNLYAKMYASKGEPIGANQWTELTESKQNGASFGTSIPTPTINMFLFDKGLAGVIVDDFRIYNYALTTAELQNVIDEDFLPSPNMKNIGHQRKYVDSNNDNTNDAFSVRLVGGIDSLAYNYVGIEIYTTVGENTSVLPTKQTSTTVYTSILEEDTPVTAAEKDCGWFIAFIIPDIPLDVALEDGEYITFKYRFYAVNDSGTIYSEFRTVSYNADGTPVA